MGRRERIRGPRPSDPASDTIRTMNFALILFLLTLATGTGKTFIAFQIVWKLFHSRWNLGDWQREPEANGQVAAQEAEAIKLHAQARWQMTVAQALEEGFKAALGGGVDNVAAAPAGAGNAAEADYGAA